MVEAEAFLGDLLSNIKLQASCYNESLTIIRELILDEVKDSDLGQMLESTTCFDHRPWQFFHDCIADASRYDAHQKKGGVNLCSMKWREEFTGRVKDLLVSNPNLAQNLAIAVLKPNPNPDGCLAEEYVESYVLKEYRSTLVRLRNYRIIYSYSKDNVCHLPSR